MGGEDGFVKILADGHIMYQKMSKTYGSVFTPKRRSHKYNFCGLPLPSQVAFECIELFAGKARLTSAQRLSGWSAVKLDLNYLGKDAEGRPWSPQSPMQRPSSLVLLSSFCLVWSETAVL